MPGASSRSATPVELYERPRTTFAARFIGTPPMNLVRARRRPDPRPAGRCPAWPIRMLRAAHRLGIRPEAIRLGDTGLAATVESIEYLGADQIVRVRVGDESLLVRAPAEATAPSATASGSTGAATPSISTTPPSGGSTRCRRPRRRRRAGVAHRRQ